MAKHNSARADEGKAAPGGGYHRNDTKCSPSIASNVVSDERHFRVANAGDAPSVIPLDARAARLLERFARAKGRPVLAADVLIAAEALANAGIRLVWDVDWRGRDTVAIDPACSVQEV